MARTRRTLSGQYPEVVMKQLHDYKAGKRESPIMAALAENLPSADINDLAAYYAYLPKARTAPTTYDEFLPALVRVGAPLRNIAPCISCHGGVDQKLGAPWTRRDAQELSGRATSGHSGWASAPMIPKHRCAMSFAR